MIIKLLFHWMPRSLGSTLLLLGMIVLCWFPSRSPLSAQDSKDGLSQNRPSAADIYQSRIVPLLKSPEKSSCSECHLQGIELSDFLADDQQQTFANLRARGWIDVEHPENSKLLEFIQRHTQESSPLIQRVREAELNAMKSWIAAAVLEPELLSQKLPAENDLELPTEFIRHTRQDQIIARFSEAIWSQLSRCANCHSPERNQQQVKKHGTQMSWIVPRQPGLTLALLVERKLIDLDHPEQSELRTKPLLLVEHGGGPKFVIGGQTDRSWLAFLKDYAKLVQGELSRSDKLPKAPERRSWLSEMQLKVTDLPESWKGRLLVISLHPKNGDGTWSDIPIAIGDSPVNRRQLVWQQSLTVFQAVDSKMGAREWANSLSATEAIPPARYQLRLRLGRLVVNEDFKPVEEDGESTSLVLVATSELDAPWPPGYQPPKIISFTSLEQVKDPSGSSEIQRNSRDSKE